MSLARVREVGHGPAVLGGGEERREIELLVGGVERREQVEDLVVDLMRAGIGPVDLVDDDDRAQARAPAPSW